MVKSAICNVIVVTHARVPHGIYWLSSDLGPEAVECTRRTKNVLCLPQVTLTVLYYKTDGLKLLGRWL